MKFTDWIGERGGDEALARQLGVTRQCVHYWRIGKSTPRWGVMFEILKMSKGRVTPADIVAVTRGHKVRGAERKAWGRS